MWALLTTSWRGAPPMLRRLAVWLWTVAALGAAASITVDVENWWGTLSFTTNLLSELIAAMFALPIALLVVNRLADYQEEMAARPRLEARVRAARRHLNTVVEKLHSHVKMMETDATAAANELVGAVGGTDLDSVNMAARSMHALMDAESFLSQRLIALVRIYGTYLTAALADLHNVVSQQGGDGDFADDIVELAQLSSDLDATVRHHNLIVNQGQQLFGHRPALARYDRGLMSELRAAASAYVRSFDSMLRVCAELEAFTSDAPATPEITT
jgi:hypothetical protein